MAAVSSDGTVIAGSVIGALLGVGVVAVAGLFLCKLWQRRKSNQIVKTLLSANEMFRAYLNDNHSLN